MLLLLLISFLLSPLTLGSPHPQRGNRHQHGVNPIARTTTAPVIVAQAIATQSGGSGSGVGTIISTTINGAGANPTTLLNNPNPSSTVSTSPIISDTPSTGTGNGKRGLAYNSSSPSLTVFSNTDITWCHDWNSAPDGAPSEFMFVPTLWSDKSPHSDNWDQNAAGHHYLMSFNEPDIVAQANMPVNYAVDKYKTLMFPKRSATVKIGAPSVTSGSGTNEAGIPMGTGWLRQFLSQCNDDNTCQADFVSGHWYGCPDGTCTVQDDINGFTGYISDLVSTAQGREVWIPEFQRYGDEAGQKQFLKSVLPTLDGNAAVTRYAYFMVAEGILTTGGQVNDLGAAFAG